MGRPGTGFPGPVKKGRTSSDAAPNSLKDFIPRVLRSDTSQGLRCG
jgi:hypothetical protein